MAYDNPAGLIAMSVILETLAVGSVILRFMSRRKMRAGLQADDWLILAALLPATGLTIIEIYGVVMEAFGYPWYGHASRPKFDRYYRSLRLQFAFMLLNTIGITLVKLSVVFLFRRIFTRSNTFRHITLGWIIVLVLWGTSFTFWIIFKCGSHVSATYGDYPSYQKYCSKNDAGGYALGYTDLLTDIGTLLLPLPMIAKLKTSLRRKIAIAAVFAVGVFTVAATATRAAIYTYIRLHPPHDPLVTLTSMSVWHYLDVMVGVCAACAVTFQPIFSTLRFNVYTPHFLSSTFTRRNSFSKDSDNGGSETCGESVEHEKSMTDKGSRSNVEIQTCHETV